MDKVQISVWVDESLKDAVVRYCQSKGFGMDNFIEEALIDRLEEVGDIEDVRRIRSEATRPLAEVQSELDGRP